jgi:hypothetical protein
MPPAKKSIISLSQLLREISRGEGAKISLREMVDHFGDRAFGAALFTFAIPNVLPLPPGASGVLGLPLVLVAPQLMVGLKGLWLPRWLGRRQIDRSGMERAFRRLLPTLEKVERLSRPRWTFLFGPVGDRVLGLTCFLLALVLALPIPFGNMLPGAAIATLSLSLIQRDGALAALGYLMAASSWLVLGLSFHVIVTAAQHLLVFFGL